MTHEFFLRAKGLFFSVLVSAVAFASFAGAQAISESKPIGKIIIVTGTVTIEHTKAVAQLATLSSAPTAAKAGDSVYLGDVIQTGADGKAGITFADDTAFNVSSNARMVLDQFVYDPKGKSNASVFNLTKGTFSLVAGKVAKTGTMNVETPVATMGIRGTTPHVEIAEDGTISFATLIEEGKSEVEKKRRGAPKKVQRKADFQSLDNNVDIKLKICQGC